LAEEVAEDDYSPSDGGLIQKKKEVSSPSNKPLQHPIKNNSSSSQLTDSFNLPPSLPGPHYAKMDERKKGSPWTKWRPGKAEESSDEGPSLQFSDPTPETEATQQSSPEGSLERVELLAVRLLVAEVGERNDGFDYDAEEGDGAGDEEAEAVDPVPLRPVDDPPPMREADERQPTPPPVLPRRSGRERRQPDRLVPNPKLQRY
jgi:hypothetical protein